MARNAHLEVVHIVEFQVQECGGGGGFGVRVLRLFFAVVASAKSLGNDRVLRAVEGNGLVMGIVHAPQLLLLRYADSNGEIQEEEYEEGDHSGPYNRYHHTIQLQCQLSPTILRIRIENPLSR